MKHSFIASKLDPTKCASCTRAFVEHTKYAHCEACKEQGDCEIDTASNMLLCWECKDRNVRILIEKTTRDSDAQCVINDAMKIDKSMQFNGDFYNAKTVAIMEIKKAIDADDSVADKQFAFQAALAERYAHLKSVVFDLDNKKHEAITEQLAIGKTLRDFGNDLRAQFREQLRVNDANYVPVAPKVIKPKLVKKSPMDTLIQTLATMKNISLAEAEALIVKGGIK